MNRFLFAFFAFVGLSGCASTIQYVPYPTEPLDDDQARIYLFRPSIIASAIRMPIQQKGIPIGQTGPKGMLVWDVPPGLVVVTAQAENLAALAIPATAGQSYYVWQRMTTGWLYARTKMVLLDEAQAHRKMQRIKKLPKSGQQGT